MFTARYGLSLYIVCVILIVFQRAKWPPVSGTQCAVGLQQNSAAVTLGALRQIAPHCVTCRNRLEFVIWDRPGSAINFIQLRVIKCG